MADNLNENTKLDHRLDQQLVELQIETDVMNFTEFTPSEIKEATDNFHNSLKIGEGGFSIVYKGYLQQTTVAIKILKSESYQGDLKIEFNQELDILSKLKHRNLISLIGFSLEARALVYEFLPNGSLDTYLTNDINSPKKLSWQDRIRIASEICSALIFLHSIGEHGIAHGDLKPQNILLDSSFVSKIIDFGISRELEKTDQTLTPLHFTKFPKFSPLYADPEFFSSYELTPQYDTYSYGIILLQLVTGKGPYKIKEFVEEALEMGKFNTIVDSTACWPKEVAERLALLGLWCSEPSRKKRPDLAREVQPEIESMKRATYKLHVCPHGRRSLGDSSLDDDDDDVGCMRQPIENETAIPDANIGEALLIGSQQQEEESQEVEVRNPTQQGERSTEEVPAGSSSDHTQEDSDDLAAGSSEPVILYTTTIGVFRKTLDDCNQVRRLLHNIGVRFIERDVSLSMGYKEELQQLVGSENARVPCLFLKGTLIGGAHEIEQYNEAGELRDLLGDVMNSF